MNTQEIQIRAKKISELDPFGNQDNNNAYLVIGYNNGSIKQNYKITLDKLISLIGNNVSMDEETLLEKLNMFIDTNQITIPTGARGPQGPQGPAGSGSDVDLTDIQNQINEINSFLDEKFERNITYYNISYVLNYVSGNSSNPTVIAENKSATAYFSVENGYKMPSKITVTGCTPSYSPSNKSLTLANPTSDITINITGELASYSISYSFTNINYEVTSNQKSLYQINDTIELSLTATTNYKLPTAISVSGCRQTYTMHNDESATLTLTCLGTGNMSASGSGVSTLVYYFGIISIDSSTSNKIEVNFSRSNDNVITDITSINLKSTSWMISKSSCPFTINTPFQFKYTIILGKESVMIVPKQFINISTSTFTNGSSTGMFQTTSSSSAFTFNIHKQFKIDDVDYYVIDLQDALNPEESFVIKKLI